MIPFVGPDNQAGAKKVGDYLASKLAKGDKVAVLGRQDDRLQWRPTPTRISKRP